jgi:drug/metabolite transporter (DMT)-like permease
MSAQSDMTEARPVWGVIWMLATGLTFVAVTAIVKHIGGGVPAAEAAFLRYILGLVFLLPMIRSLLNAHLDKRDLMYFGARGLAHGLGVILWFFAMTKITIAEVTAMNYLSPVYVTIGAALFLGERLALRRIMAIGAALLGAMIILRPGFRELNLGHYTMLGTAILFATSYLLAKRMADRVSPTVVVAMLSITVPVVLAPFAFAVWVTPTLEQLLWLFLVAVFATIGHFTMTLAFRAAPMTVTQPVTFLQLVWATTLGAVVFGEPVDGWVVMGGLIILASVSFITWREARLKRRAITPVDGATKV